MKTPRDFYLSKIEAYQKQLQQTKKQLAISSSLRLLLFITIATLIYFTYPNVQVIIACVLVGIVSFVYMVNRHSNLVYAKRKVEKLIAVNQLELQVADGKYHHLDAGKEFIDSLHPYSHDIDIFGDRSFFQYINRTATLAGKEQLANYLKANDIGGIVEKQKAIQNLSNLPTWRQEFAAIASLVDVSVSVETIKKFLNGYVPFLSKPWRVLPWIISTISGVMTILLFLEVITFTGFMGWFFVGLAITGVQLKKINVLYQKANRIKDTFEQYYQLVQKIEEISFDSDLLKEKQQLVVSQKERASKILKKFAKILDAFDQRNNMLYGIFANGLLLWDLMQSARVEKWIEENHEQVAQWFDVISFFDSYNSLGNFAFNNPSYIYPEISDNGSILKAEQLGHPMLDPTKRVDNDIEIQKDQFFIITGANMAGKSTFLRTVALQVVMSNIGLPICAKKCSYKPIKLITSMRTSDSLSDDASYFFSELTQLKRIVDALQKDEYFIILDEILKGTNSKDKATGSRKFVERLVQAKATGIIATHDLSLCEIAKELPKVKNRYFDAQIVQDELYFDYKFKDGICQNMNASFLLNKMGIV